MKTIKFYNLELEAEKIIKKIDSIKGFTNEELVFSFEGISDFSDYKLLNGATYDEEELTEKERLEKLEDVVNSILKGGV